MKGVYVQFYRAVLDELQFLRDDARPKNNNCKLKKKTDPSILLVSFGSSHCERSSFDNRGKTTVKGIPVQSEIFELQQAEV